MIARLCLSDMHLGDPRSTLSNPEVAAKVVAELAELSGGEVGELVLNGDVWEECVPGDMDKMADGFAASVLGASRTFFRPLFDKVKVGKIVYIPATTTSACGAGTAGSTSSSRAPARPTLGCRSTGRSGRGGTRSWPGVGAVELVASYPIYWDRSAGSDYPILVFTHGHLLDPLVLGTDAEAAYVALRVLGCSRPPRPSDPTRISCVADASEPFCLALWARYSRRDYAYANYVMRRVDCPQQCQWQEIFISGGDGCYATDCPIDQPPANQGRLGDVPRFLDLVMTDPDLPSPGRGDRGRSGGTRLQPAVVPGIRARPPGRPEGHLRRGRALRCRRLGRLDERARGPPAPLARPRLAEAGGRRADLVLPAGPHPRRRGPVGDNSCRTPRWFRWSTLGCGDSASCRIRCTPAAALTSARRGGARPTPRGSRRSTTSRSPPTSSGTCSPWATTRAPCTSCTRAGPSGRLAAACTGSRGPGRSSSWRSWSTSRTDAGWSGPTSSPAAPRPWASTSRPPCARPVFVLEWPPVEHAVQVAFAGCPRRSARG